MKPGDVLVCRACRHGYSSSGEIPNVCAHCGANPAVWTTMPDPPRKPYYLNENDKSFLKARGIRPE